MDQVLALVSEGKDVAAVRVDGAHVAGCGGPQEVETNKRGRSKTSPISMKV